MIFLHLYPTPRLGGIPHLGEHELDRPKQFNRRFFHGRPNDCSSPPGKMPGRGFARDGISPKHSRLGPLNRRKHSTFNAVCAGKNANGAHHYKTRLELPRNYRPTIFAELDLSQFLQGVSMRYLSHEGENFDWHYAGKNPVAGRRNQMLLTLTKPETVSANP